MRLVVIVLRDPASDTAPRFFQAANSAVQTSSSFKLRCRDLRMRQDVQIVEIAPQISSASRFCDAAAFVNLIESQSIAYSPGRRAVLRSCDDRIESQWLRPGARRKYRLECVCFS